MLLSTENYGNIPVTTAPREKVLKYIEKYLNAVAQRPKTTPQNTTKSLILFTPNPEQLVYARRHKWAGEMLKQADIAVPDGIGLVLASRLFGGRRLAGRIAGIDLAESIMHLASKKSVRIGLIGGLPGVADEAAECLRDRISGATYWVASAPQINVPTESTIAHIHDAVDKTHVDSHDIRTYAKTLAGEIAQEQVSVVFVGLGFPKQELLIYLLRAEFDRRGWPVLCMAVGGSLDVWAGNVRRAPGVVRRVGLEWLWRLSMQPWRWKRQLALLSFVGMAIREKFASKR